MYLLFVTRGQVENDISAKRYSCREETIMKRYNVLFLAALFLSVTSTGSADVGAQMEECNDCHGDNGVSQWSDVPTISGIAEFVHADALFVFKDGERTCAESDYRQGDTSRPPTNMCDIAAALSDDDIEAIAAEYAALPYVKAVQDFDADLAAVGEVIHSKHCDRCHADAGMDPEDEAGMLGGQWMEYLRSTFAEYAAGNREQMDKMKDKMELLGDDDIEALIHYYGSQQ
jgi:sulfide dehydrogenase cytochrome subunit